MTNHITTKWLGGMAFESTNTSGNTFKIEDKEESDGLRPKSLMLSALAGCSGLDVASLIKKMKLEVDTFKIDTIANMTEEHPKHYDAVVVEYHFYGSNLNEERLQRAVNLSVDKYCGVFEMFRQFAKMETKVIFHHK
ncbi:putative redox protein [Saonia flava]|uniref:Putative redox protein n=1 Tax=Saonia flava TaxID=523696 RepID=A0A846R0F2_9FLAO|nr:OsmC family protein [Saonia flava]NJB71395.1 putative redox protein [Saonia flava]